MIIVKKDGRKEVFSKKKLFNSIYESFLNAHHNKRNAGNFAKKVSNEALKHLKNKKIINSSYVFKIIATLLEKYDKDATFLYETHRDIS